MTGLPGVPGEGPTPGEGPEPGDTHTQTPQIMTKIRTFRPKRMIPAVLTALALIAVGTLVAVNVISTMLGRPTWTPPYHLFAGWAASTPWQAPAALLTGAILALIGLLLIALALVPGRPKLLPLRSTDPDLVVGVKRGVAGHALAVAATRVDGVRSAWVRLPRGRIEVSAHTDLRDPHGIPEQIHASVSRELERLAPAQDLPIKVTVRHRGTT
ncbi:DUF6286 domain-containing protein [Rhizohabitans arisaemae]|uniref:DUF6286 domain-containing protein n=1 Tax=Rhizohabitans arisaemae TaxID=2720610 RepID=UPI0024B085F8|nr:DUF6286 domain-containing protein [Rhizohabitans arisaemae]